VLEVLILLSDFHLANDETRADILDLFECDLPGGFRSSPDALAMARLVKARTATAEWRSRSGADHPDHN
jgi:hypothetical protein